jgi:hypothetical protein
VVEKDLIRGILSKRKDIYGCGSGQSLKEILNSTKDKFNFLPT